MCRCSVAPKERVDLSFVEVRMLVRWLREGVFAWVFIEVRRERARGGRISFKSSEFEDEGVGEGDVVN